MKKGIIIILSIICFALIGCKKETETGACTETIQVDLSKYELGDFSNVEYEYDIDNNVNFSYMYSNMKEPFTYISLEFEIGRSYYGYPETVGTVIDFMNAGYIDSSITETKAKESSLFISLDKIGSGMSDLGLTSSIKEISLEEAQELGKSKSVFHFVELKNPKNIVTGTTYDFSLIKYELFKEEKSESIEETNIEYEKMVYTLNQYYVYEIISLNSPGYILNDGNPVVTINGENGFLIRSEYEYLQYENDELLSKYEIDYINYDYRDINKPYQICTFIKKYALETDYYISKTTNIEALEVSRTNVSINHYDCILYSNYLKALDNYNIDINNIYQEVTQEEFKEITIENTSFGILLYNDIEAINKKIDDNNSLFKVEFNNNGYFLVKCEFDGNEKYYRFNSIDDCDLCFVTKVYYVINGLITKDLINNIDYNIKTKYVIDVTQINSNGYQIKNNRYYAKSISYSFDGLVVILNKNDLNTDKDTLILGKDIAYNAAYDLKNIDGSTKVILKEITKTAGGILNAYSNAYKIETIDVYSIDYFSNKLSQKLFDSYLYSVDLSDVINKIK